MSDVTPICDKCKTCPDCGDCPWFGLHGACIKCGRFNGAPDHDEDGHSDACLKSRGFGFMASDAPTKVTPITPTHVCASCKATISTLDVYQGHTEACMQPEVRFRRMEARIAELQALAMEHWGVSLG